MVSCKGFFRIFIGILLFNFAGCALPPTKMPINIELIGQAKSIGYFAWKGMPTYFYTSGQSGAGAVLGNAIFQQISGDQKEALTSMYRSGIYEEFKHTFSKSFFPIMDNRVTELDSNKLVYTDKTEKVVDVISSAKMQGHDLVLETTITPRMTNRGDTSILLSVQANVKITRVADNQILWSESTTVSKNNLSPYECSIRNCDNKMHDLARQASHNILNSLNDHTKFYLIIDGKEIKKNSGIIGLLVYSPDSTRLAYVLEANTKECSMVIDGVEEQKKYDAIHLPSFSPDSRHMAYGARKGDKWFVVVDGIEGKKYDKLLFPSSSTSTSTVFSSDSQHVFYWASENNKWFTVVDGKEGKKHDDFVGSSLREGHDGKSFTTSYVAKSDNKWFLFEDNKVIQEFDKFVPYVSPDRNRLVYRKKENNKWFVQTDGKDGKKYDEIQFFGNIFSPNSKHVAYLAREDNQWRVVIDGNEVGTHNQVNKEALLFSPDSQHVAYVTYDKDNDMTTVVVDGKKQETYRRIHWNKQLFSFDSKHVVYSATIEDDKWFVVVDGAKQSQYHHSIDNATLSPDGKHVAYVAKKIELLNQ
jgi:hypothetical protein